MIRTKAFLCAGFLLALIPARALADAPVSTINGGARVEYRFDYLGDRSAIKVAVTDTDPNSLVVSVYTSDQIDAVRRGEPVAPVGRGTPVRGDTLQWSGGFPIKGVYYVVLESRAQSAMTYRISITGSGVGGAARAVPVGPPITSSTTDQSGRKILNVNLPPGSITNTLQLVMPGDPGACTPAKQIPSTINHSLKLCPGEIYPPLNIVGNNIALYADDARSALVASNGQQFAITLQGSNNWVEGVTIQARADPKDAGAWLCLYDECLLPTRPVTTTLRGGTIGIATVEGRSNYIIENQLSDLNGWGSFNTGSLESYYVGNVWSRDNHGCTAPDGRKFLSGCETSGWVCLGCTANLIARNQCELSSNCFYMSGDRGLASNDNNFLSNYCAGAAENCFEITFSFGNVLRDNTATVEYKSDKPCKYPFWIGGSIAFFANNIWECAISEDDALNQSRDSTTAATNIIRLDNILGAQNAPAITPPPPLNPPTPTPDANTPDFSWLSRLWQILRRVR
ncbi:MAG: hypothetical protein KGJ80_18700 [Chloroflexota bacterium]|nr:hypothetical protein [Chloroflexota bacterium]